MRELSLKWKRRGNSGEVGPNWGGISRTRRHSFGGVCPPKLLLELKSVRTSKFLVSFPRSGRPKDTPREDRTPTGGRGTQDRTDSHSSEREISKKTTPAVRMTRSRGGLLE